MTVSEHTPTPPSATFHIVGAQLVTGEHADILLRDGVIAQVGTVTDAAGATRVDADGLVALPGLVDLHTHLREPGYEQSETVITGTQAAAAGGFTAVVAQADTPPGAGPGGGAGVGGIRNGAAHRSGHCRTRG